ncbi:enolase C-terminal domain-like protein [Kutzneria kofuensis]|uniref:L-alanine-DL-glutamate epimerase-like enolase superfamily enzyme n=1 Tax=Kutzneria kofuensis TaxID=103725 RepID=A0A7W9KPW8_9PSEU|nr:enolase C-terminal domain-like protein [Kutzneria kofuensis]MBB5896565.1 L-alanine-DL-glutamate epimerase-like enolase superfamily enzyme [Kutzneria kofuensis]
MTRTDAPVVDAVEVHAFTVPTDGPDGTEQDGTLDWHSTTMVLVTARSGDAIGIGYTYGEVATAHLIGSKLTDLVTGADALAPVAAWQRMFEGIRNAGRPGLGAMAVSAVDIALWDLKARLLDLPLVRLLPAGHDAVPIYGSGGFTNYPHARLAEQLAGWVGQGIPRVKLKVGRNPDEDRQRLAAVRHAIGPTPELFVDANGAFTPKQAAAWARRYHDEWGVIWFEEPVSSADLEGLRLVRDRAPAPLEVAAGEYGYVLRDFTNLVTAGAVDCLQADLTRCGGVTGLLAVAGLADAHELDLSAHCAPALSAHAFCAVRRLRHLEYFHDHTRIEALLFDGVLTPVDGTLRPALDRPGTGLAVKWPDAERYRVFGPEQ